MRASTEASQTTAWIADLDPLIHAPARLRIVMHLYIVERADYIFLKDQTGMSWGNLSTHLSKLEQAGYVELERSFRGKKPHTMVRLTSKGRRAFNDYRSRLQQGMDKLPD